MDESQRRQYHAMVLVHREFAAAQAARRAALVRAATFTMSGVLTVGQVSRALGVSEATWHRWVRDLGLRDLAAECVADVDRVLRGQGATDATDVGDVAGADVEAALGSVGVWRRGG